jgi:hypothetical protein
MNTYSNTEQYATLDAIIAALTTMRDTLSQHTETNPYPAYAVGGYAVYHIGSYNTTQDGNELLTKEDEPQSAVDGMIYVSHERVDGWDDIATSVSRLTDTPYVEGATQAVIVLRNDFSPHQ